MADVKAKMKSYGKYYVKSLRKKFGKVPPVGSGERFKFVAAKAKAGGAKNPAAVAAAVGRKKYGKKKFQAMAAAGKK